MPLACGINSPSLTMASMLKDVKTCNQIHRIHGETPGSCNPTSRRGCPRQGHNQKQVSRQEMPYSSGCLVYSRSTTSNGYQEDGDSILHAPGLISRSKSNGADQTWAKWTPSWLPAELVRRMSVTFAMICLARIGHYIPIPDLNIDLIRNLDVSGMPKSITASLTGSASEIGGNIYLLSITPYMTAGLTLAALQLIPEIRRHVESLRDEGRSGREAINNYTSILFVVAALIQSVTHASQLKAVALQATKMFQFQTALTLMAGAVVCKFAVQNIEQYGLGDGTGIVIGASIALSYSEYVHQLWNHIIPALPAIPPLWNIVAALCMCFGTVVLVTWVQAIELQLPLTFFSARRGQSKDVSAQHPVIQKLSIGRNNIRNDIADSSSIDMQSLFPLRLSPSGTRQLLFANFWVSLLETPLQLIGISGIFQNPFAFAGIVFVFEALSFSDATPKQMSTFLSQNDAGITGLSPGDATTAFLKRRRAQLKLLNAAFISAVSLLSRLIDFLCIGLVGFSPGMLSILLLISTILGGSRQVQALTAGNRVKKRLDQESQLVDSIAMKTI